MSIDMKNYMGAPDMPQEASPAQAATEQLQTNSYQSEQQESDFATPDGFQTPSQPPQEAVQEPSQPDKQDLNFQALRKEVDRIKAERDVEKREYQLQLDMLRANSAPRQPEAPPRKMFDGMEDSDVPNVGEIRRNWEEREGRYQAKIDELTFAQEHPDYAEVLDKHLGPLVKQKPHLAKLIQHSPNPAMAAYELGKMHQAAFSNSTPPAQQLPPAQKSLNAQKMVDNARKPGTLAQAGGQSALSKADYFATMSDSEFLKFASKNLESI